MTSDQRIRSRLRTEESLLRFRRKIHDLRAMVVGDFSSVDDKSTPQSDPTDLAAENQSWKAAMGMMDVLVTDFEAGTSNKLLQAIRTLSQQSAFHFPEIEFEDISAEEAAVNSLYLKKRLGPRPHGCYAVPHMRRTLLHYVIDGIGWVWTGVRDGKPAICAVDTINVTWDLVTEVTDARWVAVRWCDTLAYWVEMYGEKPFAEMLGNTPEEKDKGLERVVELMFYYDVDGAKGTHAVYIVGEGGINTEPIELVENPHTMDCDGIQTPFLPLVPCSYLALPSTKVPTGIAELILPAQLALRGDERYMNSVIERGAAWLEAEEGAYEKEEWDKLSEGEIGEMIKRKKGSTGAEVKGGAEIPQTVIAHTTKNEGEIFSASGADPYSSGSKVTGIKYAAEVTAIQGNASLVAGWIAMDHADCWKRVVRNVLANAKKYDQQPLRLTLDDDELQFGPGNPIGEYLRDDADAVVAEDTMAFAPRDKRIADASAFLNMAVAIKLDYPGVFRIAVERLLRAEGVRNVASAMQAPTPPPMMPGAPGTPGAETLDPSAMAAANTAA